MLTIDLETRCVIVDRGGPIPFTVGAEQRLALRNGWDETEMILNAFGAEIAAFETGQKRVQPWLFEAEVSR